MLPGNSGIGSSCYIKLLKGNVQLGETVTVSLTDGRGSAYINNRDQGILDLSGTVTDIGTLNYRAYVFSNTGDYMYELGYGSGVYAKSLKAGKYDIIMVPDFCPVTAFKASGTNTAVNGGTPYIKSELVTALNALYGAGKYINVEDCEVKAGEEKTVSEEVPYNKLISADAADSGVIIPESGEQGGSWEITGVVRSLKGKKHKELHFVSNDPVAIYGITINGKSRPMKEYYWDKYSKWGIYVDVSDVAPPYRFTAYVGDNNSSQWKDDRGNIMNTTVLLTDSRAPSDTVVLKSGDTFISKSLSLTMPRRSAAEKVDFGGKATAGAAIDIYDHGVLCGHAKADSLGNYSGTLSINKDFRQHAITAVDNKSGLCSTSYVSYSDKEAALSKLYMVSDVNNIVECSLTGQGRSYNVYGEGYYNNVRLTAIFKNADMLDDVTLPGDDGAA